MNISLTPQLETYIKQKVDTGMYHSVSEVVREALRLLEDRDSVKSAKLQALRQDVTQGLSELEQGMGQPLDVEAIKAQARKRHTQR